MDFFILIFFLGGGADLCSRILNVEFLKSLHKRWRIAGTSAMSTFDKNILPKKMEHSEKTSSALIFKLENYGRQRET